MLTNLVNQLLIHILTYVDKFIFTVIYNVTGKKKGTIKHPHEIRALPVILSESIIMKFFTKNNSLYKDFICKEKHQYI